MSTRGAIGFHIQGQDKVTYNHSDSYPSWLGRETLQWLRTQNVESLKKAAKAITMVSENDEPTDEQITRYQDYVNTQVGNQTEKSWYCLLRDTQGSLQPYLEGVEHMIDSSEFLLDSLFCEYAYIINLDTKMLEFYSGFSTLPEPRRGRYATIHRESEYSGGEQYYGVARVWQIPLSEIQEWKDEDIDNAVKIMERKCASFQRTQERKKKVAA